MSSSTNELVGLAMHDGADRRVGKITAVYRYPPELDAPWGVAAVTRGWLIHTTNLVDLRDAGVQAAGLRVPHSRARISTAPHRIPLIGDTLSDRDAAEVRTHYGVADAYP